MKIDSGSKLGLAIIALSAAILIYTMTMPSEVPTAGMFAGARTVGCGDDVCSLGENSNRCDDCDYGYDFYGYINTQGACEFLEGGYSLCLSAVFKGQEGISDVARIHIIGEGIVEKRAVFEGQSKIMNGFNVTLIDAIPADVGTDTGYALVYVDILE